MRTMTMALVAALSVGFLGGCGAEPGDGDEVLSSEPEAGDVGEVAQATYGYFCAVDFVSGAYKHTGYCWRGATASVCGAQTCGQVTSAACPAGSAAVGTVSTKQCKLFPGACFAIRVDQQGC